MLSSVYSTSMKAESVQYSFQTTTTTTTTATTASSESITTDINSNMSTTTKTNVSASVPEGCVVLKVSDFVPWDNPDNLISQQTEQMFDMIVAVVFLNILFLISAPTNIINMIAFYKQGIKERINLCLFFQSLADLLYMTINFLLYVDRIYLEITKAARRGPLFQFILNNYLTGFYGFSWASGFMTMVIACERCFCVVSPFRSHAILKTKTMAVIIGLAFCIIVGGFFVVGTRWSIACVFNPKTMTTSPEIYPRDFYLKNQRALDILDGVVYGLALPVTFVFAVSVSTIVTVVKLKQMTSWREQTSSVAMSARDVALTRMLIGTSVLFIVCSAPGVVFRTLILFVPDISLNGRYYNTFTFMVSVTELFGYINSSINFFIYYFVGSKYKETVNSMFRRRGVMRNKTDVIKSMDSIPTQTNK